MAKRMKRVQKGTESIIEEIERHFLKLENDIREGKIERGRYHFKEIDKSLLTALEIKLGLLTAVLIFWTVIEKDCRNLRIS